MNENKVGYLMGVADKAMDAAALRQHFGSNEDQSAAPTRARRLWRARQWLKKLIRVPLGMHYQYRPRPLLIPKHYYQTLPKQSSLVVSIVTPSYNQGRFLERTLRSVLDQNYPSLELVIQDGGSSDETHEILARYQSQFTHCESAMDRGQAHAINLGFQHATGNILGYLNSDDLLLPGTLSYVSNFFAKHPEVDVVYGHRVLVDTNDAEVGRWVLPRHDDDFLRWADFVPQETLFWRRRIWEKVGGALDESFHYALDWDLLLRFLDAGAKFVRLPRFLGAFRLHPEQKTSLQMFNLGVPEMDRLCLRSHGRPITHRERYRNIIPYICRHLCYHMLYQVGALRY